jgi:hypothetical protein
MLNTLGNVLNIPKNFSFFVTNTWLLVLTI